MNEFKRADFAYWLRLHRRVEKPMSQEHLGDLIGVTQEKISRWEAEVDGTQPPELDECLRLADVFDADFIELATMCGRWGDDIERMLRAQLAQGARSARGKPRPNTVSSLGAPLRRQSVDYRHSVAESGRRPQDNRPTSRKTKVAA